MSLEQVGSDRSCFYVTPRRRKRRRGESRNFAKDLISDPVLRVTAEACMLLQRPNVQIGQVDPIDDSLKSLALLPWTLYDRRSVSSLFDVVFHHAWMSHERGGAGGVDEEDVVRAVLERLVIRVEEEATTTAITTTATKAGTSNRTDTLIAVECMMKCGEGLCRDCLRERGDWVLSPRGRLLWLCDGEECALFRKWAMLGRAGPANFDSKSKKRLIRAELENKCCEVCGSGGDESKFLLCDMCDEGYHIYCCDPPLTELPKEDEEWICHRCKDDNDAMCAICGRGDDEYHMLLCERCCKGFHLRCVGLELFPLVEKWHCGDCEVKVAAMKAEVSAGS
eukprot:g4445.t1